MKKKTKHTYIIKKYNIMNIKSTKIIIAICLLFSVIFNLNAQNFNDSIKWLSFDNVRTAFEKNQKPIMIFLYDKNSDSSRIMSQTTFSNPEVANYINALFYPLRLDVYSKEAKTFFDGVKYENKPENGAVHDLALMLTGGNDTLPALVMFNRKAQGRTIYGFKNRDEIFRILIYYAENIDEKTSFEDWLTYHRRAFPPGQEQIITRLIVKWLLPKEMLEKQSQKPKKILLNFYDWRKVSCTVLRTKVFNDKRIANYINEHFYPISIDVFSKDTITLMGRTYINEGAKHGYHQLPIAALGGYMKFPAFIIIDENNKVREKFQNFYTVEELKPILEFYGEDAYLKETWNDFFKKYNKKTE